MADYHDETHIEMQRRTTQLDSFFTATLRSSRQQMRDSTHLTEGKSDPQTGVVDASCLGGSRIPFVFPQLSFIAPPFGAAR